MNIIVIIIIIIIISLLEHKHMRNTYKMNSKNSVFLESERERRSQEFILGAQCWICQIFAGGRIEAPVG